MNKLIGLAILALVALGVWRFTAPKPEQPVGGGGYYSFYDTTKASSTVSTSSWTLLATSTPDQGFHRICDTALGGVNTNNPIYLNFTASSTAPIPNPPYGTKLASGECYEMSRSKDNMFVGFIFARASTSASSIVQLFK